MNRSSADFSLVQSNGQEIIINEQIIIGRLPECTLQIDDSLVSRQHTKIEISGQRVVITDLGSHNGTWVNEQKITHPTELQDGDQVRIGRNVFVFRTASTSPEIAATRSESPRAAGSVSTMMWQTVEPLTLVRGDGAEFGLNSDAQIGRDESNNLVLAKDTSASQFHARLALLNGQVVISDLHSQNGTWVNGKRITQPSLLKHGDKIRVGNTVFRLRVGDRPLPPMDATTHSGRPGWLGCTSLSISAIAVMLVVGSLIAPSIGRLLTPTSTPSPTPAPTLTATATQSPIHQALRAVDYVQVMSDKINCDLYNDAGKKVRVLCANRGSGSVISEQGYILTNFHVLGNAVTNENKWQSGTGKGDLYDNDELIVVGLNSANPEATPDTFYKCELVAMNPDLDLAILHIVAIASAAGDPFTTFLPSKWTTSPLSGTLAFPFLHIGNSDLLHIGDPIITIGFPVVGGHTATQTSGIVSGFLPDEYLGFEKGWIKTDAEINPGNSGGMAINLHGELIGVPTATLSSSGSQIAYIRPINSAYEFIRPYIEP